MSLRQDVLRSLTLSDLAVERKRAAASAQAFDGDSDDELINVVSLA